MQELRVHASASLPGSRIARRFHKSRQAAIALLFEEQRPMLLAAEIPQRQLPKYCQLMTANQAVHASSKHSRNSSPVLLQIVDNLPPNLPEFNSPSFCTRSTKILNPF